MAASLIMRTSGPMASLRLASCVRKFPAVSTISPSFVIPRASDVFQAQAHRVRQAWRAAHIKAQLRGARNLVHVLAARAARPDEGHDNLGLIERDPVRNFDHAA